MDLQMYIQLSVALLLAVFKLTQGRAITTKEKSAGKIREDRLDYAVSEERLVYIAKFLQRFGYIGNNTKVEDLSQAELVATIRRPLKKYQRFSGLNVTGEADEETVSYILLPRCSDTDTDESERVVNDSAADDNEEYAEHRGRSPVTRVKWRKKILTYRVSHVPAKFNTDKVIARIKTAAQQWEDASGLDLRYVQPDKHADIDFSFERIDDRMNVLGRALYPPVGKVVFDSIENWDFSDIGRKTPNRGPKFLNVATHEFGHALGIKHLPNRNSIMFPTYIPSKPFELAQDDIAAIRILFGGKKRKRVNKPIRKSEQSSEKEQRNDVDEDVSVDESVRESQEVGSVPGELPDEVQPRDEKPRRRRNKKKSSKHEKDKKKSQSQTTSSPQSGGILELITGLVNREVLRRASAAMPRSKVNGESSTYNVETVVRRVSGSENSRVVVNGEVVNSKRRQKDILNRLASLDRPTSRLPTESFLENDVAVASDDITTVVVTGETTSDADVATSTSSTTTDSTTDDDSQVTSDPTTTSTDSPPTTSRGSSRRPATTVISTSHIKAVSIPAHARLAMRGISLVDLTTTSQSARWNGELAWLPEQLVTSRMLIMGVEDGVEVMDTAPSLRMFAAREVLPHGPGKMVALGGNVYMINKGRHCILTINHVDISVLAGMCGTAGFYDGGRVAAKFRNLKDMCFHSSGNLYILDEGNSRIRVLNKYNGTVSTFAVLPKKVEFESLHCSGSFIYLSGNDRQNSYIYKLSIGVESSMLERVVSLTRGDGSSGSILAGTASAYGLFKHIVQLYGHFLINDGGLLRELDISQGSIYTLCNQRKQTKEGIPGTCDINLLDSLYKVGNDIFGVDISQKKLVIVRSN